MPIYEYRCEECGEIFEKLTTSAQEKATIHCCKCKGDKVTKLLSAGATLTGKAGAAAALGGGGGGCGHSGFS
ncbi:MAG: hypothetical protein CSA20_03145 [Deltaproteobacteria bacterium]|nr:MAG: hypothetical protein CSB23_05405 [Deltaproteobacteria bacterium]PIE73425.1 MAG: hypothetical protein CSA20_03145 [Deltaproteobacteria bacterium]